MRFSGLHACLLARSWTSHCLHCMQFSAESGKPGALVTPPGCCARFRSPGSAPLPRPAPPRPRHAVCGSFPAAGKCLPNALVMRPNDAMHNSTPVHFSPFFYFRKKEHSATKKDRVTHCLTICESIVAQSLR